MTSAGDDQQVKILSCLDQRIAMGFGEKRESYRQN
jgi:hypothetical protein